MSLSAGWKTNVAGIYLIDKGLGLAKNHPLCCFVAIRFRAHFKLRIIVANNSWTVVWDQGCLVPNAPCPLPRATSPADKDILCLTQFGQL